MMVFYELIRLQIIKTNNKFIWMLFAIIPIYLNSVVLNFSKLLL
jgi:hypothetical protein